MRQQRIAAATMVAKQLFESEAAIDRALTAIARLQAVLPEARMEANLSATVGQGVIEQVGRALTAMVRVRSAIVDVHSKLDGLKTDIGLRQLSMSGGMAKPGKETVTYPDPPLRLVTRSAS
jgi:phosphoglycerate-specific signal transduction histidine kinase